MFFLNLLLLVFGLPIAPLPEVRPNDNRVAGGHLRDGIITLTLDARIAAWRPDTNVDSSVTVLAFAETDGVPRIPGPLLRTAQGSRVRVTLRNSVPDSVLIVHGLRTGGAADTLHVGAGATRVIDFTATRAGTFLYWAATSQIPLRERRQRDSQLTGAIVIDAPDAPRDTAERIFVITMLDIYPDSPQSVIKDDLFELAINGMSWPHTERFTYPVNQTVRWRWLNGSSRGHPMHLHGFHFRVRGRGDINGEHIYGENDAPLAVTEVVMPGGSFRMDWVPTRAGNWLMHCHMAAHISPFPARTDSARVHDTHDVARHPLSSMSGLVLGIATVDPQRAAVVDPTEPTHRLRLFVQRARSDSGRVAYGFVLQEGAEPRADSVVVPGSPLVLTRGVTSAITVINRLPRPTSVHWHGMELRSLYDGVAGWSGATTNVAPLLAHGDSFVVTFTPPRAGTYIYHTHMDEEDQLSSGLYGPLIVLEPGQRFDNATDRVFMIGNSVTGGKDLPALNGAQQPAPLTLRAGVTYRLRFINIMPVIPADLTLTADSLLLRWQPISKDGADLPASLRSVTNAKVRIGVGETYDYMWTPDKPGQVQLEIVLPDGLPAIRQSIIVL